MTKCKWCETETDDKNGYCTDECASQWLSAASAAQRRAQRLADDVESKAPRRRERLEVATAAMQGWLATFNREGFPGREGQRQIAELCFQLADALLAELDAEPPK